MSELRQRIEPIRSKSLRRAAAGQRCTLNLPGICNYDPETVVLAHIHDEQFGKSRKADDTSGMHCCAACHSAYDLHRTGLDELTLLKLVFRAYQRTIRRLVQMGEMKVKLDAPLTGKPPAPKAKSTNSRSRAIPQRETVWPKREMKSRNTFQKAKA
jgi:hypothetical protein